MTAPRCPCTFIWFCCCCCPGPAPPGSGTGAVLLLLLLLLLSLPLVVVCCCCCCCCCCCNCATPSTVLGFLFPFAAALCPSTRHYSPPQSFLIFYSCVSHSTSRSFLNPSPDSLSPTSPATLTSTRTAATNPPIFPHHVLPDILQLVYSHRFQQIIDRTVNDPSQNYRLVRVHAHHQYRDINIQSDLLQKFKTIHIGHVHVG